MAPPHSSETTPVPELEAEHRLETVRLDALIGGEEGQGIVEMHRKIASRLLQEGAPARAFSELVRATREVPMNARLSSVIANVAVRAGTMSAAQTLLAAGLEETEGDERRGVRRSLARLYRKTDQLEQAREQLVLLLAEAPDDRIARFTLNALLEREERWDELDASLEKETKEALRKGAMRRASRTALRRARLWGERLDNPARAALRYGQAAQYAEQGQDSESAFLLRLLWLRALHKSKAPERALAEAVESSLRAGERVNKADRVRQMVRDLGLPPAATVSLTEIDASVIVMSEGKEPTAAAGKALEAPPEAPHRRSTTQIELMAVAELAQQQHHAAPSVVAAVLSAAVEEGPDPQALKKLEAHHIARGNWRELAQFYRDTAAKTKAKAEKVPWVEKLAELLESELDDAVGAAKAWAEVAALTGDQRAVREQVRLHADRKDSKGVRQALDENVQRASDPQRKADALVARAEEAITRKDVTGARNDLVAAVGLVPTHAPALAALGELEGDPNRIDELEHALTKIQRRKPGRAELYRRLARLLDAPDADANRARVAWAEVLAELPEDEEARSRLDVLARDAGDTGQLEKVLRAQILKEPRGSKTRQARLELVQLLDRAARADDALAELRLAVRFEPGHQQAWLLLSERLEQKKLFAESAWALEHGTTATENGHERMLLWRKLAKLVRERLKDAVKAETLDKRADKLQRELEEDEAQHGVVTGLPRGVQPPPLEEKTPHTDRVSRPGPPSEKPSKPISAPPTGSHARPLGGPPSGSNPKPPIQSAPSSGAFARPGQSHGSLKPVSESQRSLRPVGQPGDPERGSRPTGLEGAFVPPRPSRPPMDPSQKATAALPPMPRSKEEAEQARAAHAVRESLKPTMPLPPPEALGDRPQPSQRLAKVDPAGKRKVSFEDVAQKLGAQLEPEPSPPLPVVPMGRGGVPKEAVSLLKELVAPRPPRGGLKSGAYAPAPPPVPTPAPVAENDFPRIEDDDDDEWEGSTVGKLDDDLPPRRPGQTPPAAAADEPPEDESFDEAMSGEDDLVEEIGTSDLEPPSDEWDAPPAAEPEDPGRNTQELPAALGDPSISVPPSFGPSPSKLMGKEREQLFERVRAQPLDPNGYRLLAEHFDTAGDATRSSLMLEVALALEGDPHAAPRAPKLILSATDRAGLKHPVLRGEEGELLGLAGIALCRLWPTRGAQAGTRDEFRLDMGKGAKASADALLTAVRILGLRAPDVFVSNDNGPPFALVFPGQMRMLVGRLAVKRHLPEGELRFFAGRALFTQNPDLMALRSLRREQLQRALVVLGQVLRGQSGSAEARAVRDGLPPKGFERMKQLFERVGKKLDLLKLQEGARHSANRAGLVVCGGVAPALGALRAKKALDSEVTELVRFAASERYLALRSRRLGGGS